MYAAIWALADRKFNEEPLEADTPPSCANISIHSCAGNAGRELVEIVEERTHFHQGQNFNLEIPLLASRGLNPG